MNSTGPAQVSERPFAKRVKVSLVFALLGFLMLGAEDWRHGIFGAYLGWSWFWGLVLLYPSYLARVQSERPAVFRAYGYLHWGAFYLCQSMLFGVLGGGIYRFIKDLRSLGKPG
jgi:hypothetical protein